tara:strand:- start:171 stop:743 length:573 start_codon:yes stop_codon:yes gene_type:complete
MQQQAEADLPIESPFYWGRLQRSSVRHPNIISLETFMDACVIYKALENNKDKGMTRIEGYTLDIYSNEYSWLKTLSTQVTAISLHGPSSDEAEDFLLNNVNTVLVKGPVEWPFKVYFGGSVSKSFAMYCNNNPNAIKIGNVAKKTIERGGYVEGFYFYAKTEKYLMLAKIALGGKIQRIEKIVSDSELHK